LVVDDDPQVTQCIGAALGENFAGVAIAHTVVEAIRGSNPGTLVS
jgi:hypothetical protein